MNKIITVKEIPLEELVDREAKRIATELLEKQLEAQGLPLPKNAALEIHIKQILALRPDIRESAAEVVAARRDAYSESLKAIGLSVEIAKPIVGIEL